MRMRMQKGKVLLLVESYGQRLDMFAHFLLAGRNVLALKFSDGTYSGSILLHKNTSGVENV